VDKEKRFDSVYSKKLKAGKRRTYFFDVRQTRGDDYFLTLTESTKRLNSDHFERHKIFLYKEDFNRFLSCLEETINFIKKELMPNFDYEEFDRRQEEWESRSSEEDGFDSIEDSRNQVAKNEKKSSPETEEDINW
jgi:hypothetical protein